MAGPGRRLKAVTDTVPEEPPAGVWPERGLPASVVALLEEKLDPRLVARRKGPNGHLVRYLEGFQAINQANRVFGPDHWGAELVAPVSYHELSRSQANNGAIASTGIYSATVRVRVRGCLPKADVGSATTADDSAEAHETAIKAAVTDGMKRALRQFGDQFANALYERPGPRRAREAGELADLQATVLGLGAQLHMDPDKTREAVQARAGKAFEQLDTAELARVLKAMAGALAKQPRAA